MLKKTISSFAIVAVLALSACGPQQPPPPTDPNAVPVAPPPAAAPAPVPEAPAPAPAPRPRPERRVERAPEREREQAPPPRAICEDCGVIASVQEERVTGQPTAIGTLGGAAAGGAAGGQFGKKSGKIAMIALGAIGGAFAGRAVESQVRATTVYHVIVNMDGGGTREVTVDQLNGFGVGARVRVSGNSLQYAG
ncbi:MAG: glycine zipper protein [Nevskia sp.]|nr:glycine zipper protein [Nevskia sp.]